MQGLDHDEGKVYTQPNYDKNRDIWVCVRLIKTSSYDCKTFAKIFSYLHSSRVPKCNDNSSSGLTNEHHRNSSVGKQQHESKLVKK